MERHEIIAQLHNDISELNDQAAAKQAEVERLEHEENEEAVHGDGDQNEEIHPESDSGGQPEESAESELETGAGAEATDEDDASEAGADGEELATSPDSPRELDAGGEPDRRQARRRKAVST